MNTQGKISAVLLLTGITLLIVNAGQAHIRHYRAADYVRAGIGFALCAVGVKLGSKRGDYS